MFFKTLNLNCRILHSFPMYYLGWECDSEGWIVQEDKTNKILFITTSHGSHYIGNKKELEDKLKEMEQAVQGLQKAIELLNT